MKSFRLSFVPILEHFQEENLQYSFEFYTFFYNIFNISRQPFRFLRLLLHCRPNLPGLVRKAAGKDRAICAGYEFTLAFAESGIAVLQPGDLR